MPNPRQRPIPLREPERRFIEAQREMYEQKIGDIGDWGDFLRVATILGLVALGVYAWDKASKVTPQSAQAVCGECGGQFLMALPAEGAGRYVQVECPLCKRPLVVDLGGGASAA